MEHTIFSKATLNKLLPEEMIPHYQAGNLITINHHNIIFSVVSKESKEKFVLKILDKEYYDKNLYQKIFCITDASLLLPLQIFSDTSFFYFLYPHFKTLAETLSTKSICYSNLQSLIFSIGNAIISLHEHKILHLDITPNNIFLDNEGKYYLGDFSSALPIRNLQAFFPRHYLRTGTTACFALPEQAQTPPVSYWNDCYNFALLIYALFNNGKFPDETILPPSPAIEILNTFLLKWMKCSSSIHSGMVKNFLTGLKEILDSFDKEKELQNYCLKISDCNDNHNCFLEKTPDCSIENFSFPKNTIFHLSQSKKNRIPIPLYVLLIFCGFLFLFSFYHYLSQSRNNMEIEANILSEQINSIPEKNTPSNANSFHPPNTSCPATVSPYPSTPYPVTASPYPNTPCPTVASSYPGTPSPNAANHRETKKCILDISNNTSQNNPFFKDITKTSGLQILFANNCQFSTCTIFSSLSSLKELYLSNNQISSPTGLTKLSKLEVLVLSNNKLTDISSLGKLSSLTALDLSHNNNLRGIKSLSSLKKLHYLVLTNTNVTKKEILFFQKKLPHCTIFY